MSLLERAERILPGGVNSPVRAFRGVGGTPVFVRSAQGAWLEGEDGRRYIDYIGGYGPHILGHRHPAIVAAIAEALGRGTAFGAPTLAEVEIAETIAAALPAVEMVRLVNSGTEATMSALRLARAATGRDRFVKFAGCYHGHADPFLIAAGSGAATIGVPSSPGVPAAVVADTLLAPYNDLEAVERLFQRHDDHGGNGIAAVIVEPVAGNMNLVPPVPGFLEGLRALCDRHGALLIFDEVMTGFRVAWGGAQGLLDVRPDLTTLGKVIGGGLPLAAYAGRADLMRRIAPAGPVYQAGTLSGNPLAVAAGRAALRELQQGSPYEALERAGARLQEGIEAAGRRHNIPVRVERQGSMLGLFFTAGPVHRMEDVDATDRPRFSRVFHRLLDRGVHLPPSPYETMFLSTAHGEAEIAATLEAFDAAFREEEAPPSPASGGGPGRGSG